MKRLALAVALATALLAVPVVLGSGNPKAMVLTLADVQSVPDRSGFGNLADGFVAEQPMAKVIKSKRYGRIKKYEANFQNKTVPAGSQKGTLRLVSVTSSAFVFATSAQARDFWKQNVSDYDESPAFDAVGRPKVAREARHYSLDLVPGRFFSVVIWRSRDVVARLLVGKVSDIESDGLGGGYVVQLAKRQQARIARAS